MNSFHEVLNEVQEFKKANRVVWFRGQSNSSFKLKSSLFRERYTTVRKFIIAEKNYYNLFKNKGHLYHNESDWNLVFLMQHYGVPTRLLDWTESFSVSLYFALNRWEEDCDISIYLLNPLKLNGKSLEKSRFFTIDNDCYRDRLYESNGKKFEDNSVAVHPIRNSQRIVAQQGVFTIQGNNLLSLEDEFDGELLIEGILRKLVIKNDWMHEVNDFLKLSGINTFTLFPDLVGLANHLKEKYRNRL